MIPPIDYSKIQTLGWVALTEQELSPISGKIQFFGENIERWGSNCPEAPE